MAEDRADARTAQAIRDAESVFVSSASIWELEIKSELGKLRLPDDFVVRLEESGYDRLPITFEHAREAAHLPPHHGDPFDRMLIAQARLEGLTLVTADPHISSYDVVTFTAAATTARSADHEKPPRRGRTS